MKKSLLVGLVLGFSSLSVLGSEADLQAWSSRDEQCVELYLRAMSLPTWATNRIAMRTQYPHCQKAFIFDRVAHLAFGNKDFKTTERAITARNDVEYPHKEAWQQLPGRTREAVEYWTLGTASGVALGWALSTLFSKK